LEKKKYPIELPAKNDSGFETETLLS